MKSFPQKRLFALISATLGCLLTLTSTASATSINNSAALKKVACRDYPTGSICIYVTPVNQQGSIQITYERLSTNPINGHLTWVNPAGTYFGSPNIQMSYHNIYGQTWNTWVGPGCNHGILFDNTDGTQYSTPEVCV
ncbi:MAG TPA: hypothetical protein VGL47_33280 [Amycolatopsis sp.]|uniref:hypothetical protein n=1 Tax=Amycolatopsis sp. TaxID=37632 RepID=UPI002F41AD82